MNERFEEEFHRIRLEQREEREEERFEFLTSKPSRCEPYHSALRSETRHEDHAQLDALTPEHIPSVTSRQPGPPHLDAKTPLQNASTLPGSHNRYCLHTGDGSREPALSTDTRSAELWFQRFRALHPILDNNANTEPVRVGIIDTGVFFDKTTAEVTYEGRIKGFWPAKDAGQQNQRQGFYKDTDGHGTSVASALLNVDPFCHVYIARAFTSRDEQQGLQMSGEVEENVVKAIKHAIHQWKVDILSLSFGFEREVHDIRDALREAEGHNVLVLAACGNFGSFRGWSWPARHPTVVGLYAADGYGNSYTRNPTPLKDTPRFATLGVAVAGYSLLGTLDLYSGTSIATPIAAGIVGTLIHFMRQYKEDYLAAACYFGRGYTVQAGSAKTPSNSMRDRYEELVLKLMTRTGICLIFSEMVVDREGYRVLQPQKLFEEKGEGVHLVEVILRVLARI